MYEFSTNLDIQNLKRGFKARGMSTAIKGSVTVGLQESGARAFSRLSGQSFDQAPVKFGKRLAGWVLTSKLASAECVEDVYDPLSESVFVSGDSPLSAVLHRLTEAKFIFTVANDGIEGFICLSDLDRHIVRAYFSVLVAQVEMLLAFIVRAGCSEAVVEEKIAREKMNENPNSLWTEYQAAKEKGIATHPIEYLFLGDLIDLLPKALESLGVKMPRRLLDDLDTVRQNRRFVAHSNRRLTAARGAKELRSLDLAFDRLLEGLPDLIHKIDQSR